MQEKEGRLTEPGGTVHNRRLRPGITKWEAVQRLAALEDLRDTAAIAAMTAPTQGEVITLREAMGEGTAPPPEPLQKPVHRAYISGPIAGVEDFAENFASAEEKLRAEGWDVINPARLNDCVPGLPYGAYMNACLALLPYAGAIYLLQGWEGSAGAQMELKISRSLGLLIYEEGFEELMG